MVLHGPLMYFTIVLWLLVVPVPGPEASLVGPWWSLGPVWGFLGGPGVVFGLLLFLLLRLASGEGSVA